jgi:hypothetical protein
MAPVNARARAWRLICEALFARGTSSKVNLEAILRLQHDWKEVVTLAGVHFVAPALWPGLRSRGLEQALPWDAQRYFSTIHGLNLARNASIDAQLDEVIDALNQAGIAPLLLKGAAYSKLGTHRDKGARLVSDLDVLVPKDRIAEARTAIAALGYRRACADEPAHHHLAPMVRRDSPASIELHRDVVHPLTGEMVPTHLAWSRRRDCESGRYSVPDATFSVLHRFAHDQINDRNANRLAISFRSMQDLSALNAFYGDEIQWDWLIDHTKRLGYVDQLKQWLYSAKRIAGVSFPYPVSFSRRQRVHFGLCEAVGWSRTLGRSAESLDDFSAFRIRRKYGEQQSLLSMNAIRLRLLRDLIGRRVHAAWRKSSEAFRGC